MFHQLGRFAANNPWKIGILWLVLGVVLALLAPSWDTLTQDDDVRFLPDRFTSIRAYHLLEKAFPQDVFASKLILAVERDDRPLDEADFLVVDRVVQALERFKIDHPELKLGKVDCYQDPMLGFRFTSADRQCTLIQVALSTPFLALNTMETTEKVDAAVRSVLQEAGVEGLELYATGTAGIGRDLTKVCATSLEATTTATVILVIVVLLMVYRAPLLALIPLLTIAISVWVALDALALMTAIPGVHLVNITKLFSIVILYGAGTDYCLFLISRYREELEAGHDETTALARAVGGVGEALAASAGTVMVGLGLMALAEFAKIRYAGPAIAVSLGVALIASLTLTPALLKILGRRVFWPGPVPAPTLRIRSEDTKLPFWDRVSFKVADRPLLVWCVSALVLMPLVLIGLRIEPNYRATSELSDSTQSLRGLDVIGRHFNAGEIGPVTVLLTSSKNFDSFEGQLEIDHLSQGFGHLSNVAEVRSMTQPLGSPLPNWIEIPEPENLIQYAYSCIQPVISAMVDEMRAKSREFYVTRIEENGVPLYVTRLDVILKSDPFEPKSAQTLKLIQTWLDKVLPQYSYMGGDLRAECYGITASAQDLAAVTESDRYRVNSLVLVAIFGILWFIVRNFWMATYLLVTVLASYYGALGATVLAGVFWTGAPLESVDWRVPFFLFTILVAVGEDYNILLMARALEENKRYGMVEGMRRALARTGGAITSCGLIMAGTFATLMLAGLNTLTQVGFALAFGVLIDTFLVRPFLVPAFTMLVYQDREPAKRKTDLVLEPLVIHDNSQAA